MLQDCCEDPKGLSVVPGTEYRVCKERFAFVLRDHPWGSILKKGWTQDPKLHNLNSLTPNLHPQQANLHYLICLCLRWREGSCWRSRPIICTPLLVVASKGASKGDKIVIVALH